ncbi:uncharacterized protein L3040_007830 [Drepanopeziza brunnea f. sp. 'multigermtubi']|uniref:Uncharacterized protein n=1 Tax=Marssonina brunnea f. sp. multigermtubi (strain MB_m1) TaxID=1072389 RepID=K1WJT4_MARBU|nr:uncharacterized protein MBM_08544 [Drepanopeziza brunnea f. sp. 'multigermtubi' MB_m1]EKD13101.1 hypothetical protein MBM_08544 [Drepanopeziza brunnea f. sp. 'multigermtubi' MB_m1]KAJ5035356.1 hypothetical protein L3040_007830 [Drepanopeziza brunnea f. sp. 'multigermtubi']
MDNANLTHRTRARLQEWDSAFYSGDSAGTEDVLKRSDLDANADAAASAASASASASAASASASAASASASAASASSSSSAQPSGSPERETADSQEPDSTLGSIPASRDEEGSTSVITTTPGHFDFSRLDYYLHIIAQHRAFIARIRGADAGEASHANDPLQDEPAAEDADLERPAPTSHQATLSHSPFVPGAPGFSRMEPSAAVRRPPLDEEDSEEEFPMRANVVHCWDDWREPALQREREQRARMAAAVYETAESEVERTPQRAYAESVLSDGSSGTTAVEETDLWSWHSGPLSDLDVPAAPMQREPFRSSDWYPVLSVSVEEIAGEYSDSISSIDLEEYDRGIITVHPRLFSSNLESSPRARVRTVRRRLVHSSTGLRSPITEMAYMELDSGDEADVEEDCNDVPQSESGGSPGGGGQSSSQSGEVGGGYRLFEMARAGIFRRNRRPPRRRERYWLRSDVTG